MTNSGHNPIPDANGDGGGGGGGGGGSCIAGGNIPIDRVEWSRNTILEFIEDYRGYRVLWDPNTKGYHIKQIKYEALKKLSRKYSTEVRIIRSKIKSLRSSFHREHGKVISGKRRGINYQPMWFAYEAIRFILDGERAEMGGSSGFDGAREVVAGGRGGGSAAAATAVAASTVAVAAGADTASAGIDANDEMVTLCNQLDDQQYANISADDVKTEIASVTADHTEERLTFFYLQLETSNGEIEDLKSIQPVEFDKLFRKRKQRSSSQELATENGGASSQHAQRTDSDNEEPQNSPSKSSRQTDPNTLDEFGVFGEYVGITIRKLKTSKAQVVIKHLINNLLYDAEMGRYDYGIPTSRDPPHLYATTD